MMHVSPPSRGKIATSNKAKRKKKLQARIRPLAFFHYRFNFPGKIILLCLIFAFFLVLVIIV
jgi:hypothetical protein